mgnify:CR=1 FL=1
MRRRMRRPIIGRSGRGRPAAVVACHPASTQAPGGGAGTLFVRVRAAEIMPRDSISDAVQRKICAGPDAHASARTPDGSLSHDMRMCAERRAACLEMGPCFKRGAGAEQKAVGAHWSCMGRVGSIVGHRFRSVGPGPLVIGMRDRVPRRVRGTRGERIAMSASASRATHHPTTRTSGHVLGR